LYNGANDETPSNLYRVNEGEAVNERGDLAMKQGDIIIYACVIIGAGIGLVIDLAIAGVLIGLGIGYLIKYALYKEKEN